jgi:hypothetical protein
MLELVNAQLFPHLHLFLLRYFKGILRNQPEGAFTAEEYMRAWCRHFWGLPLHPAPPQPVPM